MKTRVISAIVALAIFIPLTIIGGIWFKLGLCVLAVLGMREFLNLPSKTKRPVYVDVVMYAIVLLLTYMNENRETYYFMAMLLPLLLVLYCNDKNKFSADEAFKLIGMAMLVGTIFNKITLIREKDILLLVYLFLIPVITDTYAQLGGILIGKNKMAPTISPNKTWEGSVTGGIFGTLVASVFYYIFINPEAHVLGLLVITLFLSCLGQIGDLFFSAVKRNHEIKDFSNIMPGHGGVLDRLDSTIFVIIGYILLSGII